MPTGDDLLSQGAQFLFIGFGAVAHVALTVIAFMTLRRIARRQPIRPWQIVCTILAALVWIDLIKALATGGWHKLFA